MVKPSLDTYGLSCASHGHTTLTIQIMHAPHACMYAGLVRAKRVADKPTEQSNPTQPTTSTHSSSSSESASRCPVLSALNVAPPEVNIPWHKRMQQYAQPWEFQQQVLDDAVAQGHHMAAIQKSPGFAGAHGGMECVTSAMLGPTLTLQS